ncbi:hypothetical protein WJX79_005290 [Trebouxia sp. C0005]
MAVQALQAYVNEMQKRIDDNDYEPQFDDKDEKKDKELRESEDLHHGAVLKGTVEQGAGTRHPQEGDLVYVHISIRSPSGQLLHSTWLEEGGSGVPMALVLGRGVRAPRGWELGLQDMVCQQRCQLTIKPEYGYKHKDCHMTPPKGVSIDEPMHVDIKLLEIYSKDDVRVVGTNENIYKTIKQRSESWESPREPYEVEVSCSARVPAPSGQQGDSTPYFVAPSLKFTMGSGTAPSGLEEALSSMTQGEKAVFSCPTEYVRGSSLLPDPPHQPDRVELDLHLLRFSQVRDMTGNGEVVKRRIKEGTGQFPMDCPMADSRLQIHYRGYVVNTGQEFVNTRGADSNAQPLEFDSGMGILPEAIDMTVRLMTPGEVALITVPSQYAYDGRPDRPPGMPEGAKVEWEVELISFQKQPDWERAEPDAKIKHAGELKDQGNLAFKAGRLKPARSKYTKALRLADRIFDLETEEQAEAASFVKTACLVNLANCAHREQHFGEALDWCNKALMESHNHAKALYRRAMAFAALGELDKAQQDFVKWKEVDPSATADADAQIAKLKIQQKAANVKQKQQFRNFFART